MRGVPLIDASSLHAIEHFWREQTTRGGLPPICGLQPPVRCLFDRAGVTGAIGAEHFHWSANEAIMDARRQLADDDALSPSANVAANGHGVGHGARPSEVAGVE